VAELADSVLSPALDASRGGDRAGVAEAASDGADAGREAHDSAGNEEGRGGVVANLALAVVSPALDASCGGERAGVAEAGRDGADAGREAHDSDRNEAEVG